MPITIMAIMINALTPALILPFVYCTRIIDKIANESNDTKQRQIS